MTTKHTAGNSCKVQRARAHTPNTLTLSYSRAGSRAASVGPRDGMRKGHGHTSSPSAATATAQAEAEPDSTVGSRARSRGSRLVGAGVSLGVVWIVAREPLRLGRGDGGVLIDVEAA